MENKTRTENGNLVAHEGFSVVLLLYQLLQPVIAAHTHFNACKGMTFPSFGFRYWGYNGVIMGL